ncbi:MAG: YdbH domain-containing protein, partial [Halopseudomonas yangmingensis]
QALGAQISVTPQRLQLGEDEQLLELQLSGLELASLLEVYPTEGLYGDGLIDGRLPLRLSAAGPSISDGWLRARSGGVLQYRTPALAAMGRGNPAMAELALALDDFRYTLLQSDLEYAPDGRLQLGLRLEGANPKLQGGRPVHLNINLEEDIPALLTSLQLSGQLSEIIRKRVEQRVLQQRLQP